MICQNIGGGFVSNMMQHAVLEDCSHSAVQVNKSPSNPLLIHVPRPVMRGGRPEILCSNGAGLAGTAEVEPGLVFPVSLTTPDTGNQWRAETLLRTER